MLEVPKIYRQQVERSPLKKSCESALRLGTIGSMCEEGMSNLPEETASEPDSRFPSGEWVGFWMQRRIYGAKKKRVEFLLRFAGGVVTGEGRDCIDECVIHGRYDVASGEVTFHKRHVHL